MTLVNCPSAGVHFRKTLCGCKEWHQVKRYRPFPQITSVSTILPQPRCITRHQRATRTGDTKINTHMEHIRLNFSCVTVYGLHLDIGLIKTCCKQSELMRYIEGTVGNFDLSRFLCGDWVLTPLQNDKEMLPSQICVIQISFASELLIVMIMVQVFIAPCFDWLGTTQYNKGEYIWLMVL